jgi:hypothetical protein
MTRDQFIERLVLGETQLSFTKADGTLRHMRATLDVRLLPKLPFDLNPTNRRNRNENPDLIAVWDLDADAWRSLRFDRLISVDGAELACS